MSWTAEPGGYDVEKVQAAASSGLSGRLAAGQLPLGRLGYLPRAVLHAAVAQQEIVATAPGG